MLLHKHRHRHFVFNLNLIIIIFLFFCFIFTFVCLSFLHWSKFMWIRCYCSCRLIFFLEAMIVRRSKTHIKNAAPIFFFSELNNSTMFVGVGKLIYFVLACQYFLVLLLQYHMIILILYDVVWMFMNSIQCGSKFNWW